MTKISRPRKVLFQRFPVLLSFIDSHDPKSLVLTLVLLITFARNEMGGGSEFFHDLYKVLK